MTFPAQSPDLRRFPLVAGASRSVVRSPRSAAPRIRFLFVDSRVRFTLRSAYASRRTPCASLRSLRPRSGRTFTSKSSPMPGPPQSRRAPLQQAFGRNAGAGASSTPMRPRSRTAMWTEASILHPTEASQLSMSSRQAGIWEARCGGRERGRGQPPRDGVRRRSHPPCQGVKRFMSRGNGISSRT